MTLAEARALRSGDVVVDPLDGWIVRRMRTELTTPVRRRSVTR